MIAHVAAHEVYPMPSTHFDTLAYCKKLKAVGVPEAAAEVHAEALAEVIDQNLATKQDLYAVKKELKHDIREVRKEIQEVKKELKHDIHEVRKEIQEVKKELKHEIKEISSKLTIRMGSMVAAAVVIIPVINKIL